MEGSIQEYLHALQKYASPIEVPGHGLGIEPLSLNEIFLEAVKGERTVAKPQLERVKEAAADPRDHGIAPKEALSSESEEPSSEPEPCSEVLKRERRAVVLGEPGQGKSTLMRQYALNLSQNAETGLMPVLVQLSVERDKSQNRAKHYWVLDRFPDALSSIGHRDEVKAEFFKLFEAGKASILLDGFDELSAQGQEEIRDRIAELYPNQVVITSRPHAYLRRPISGFAQYALQSLGIHQMDFLARNFCEALQKNASRSNADSNPAIIQAVVSAAHGPAAALACNPLFLSFLCVMAVNRAAAGTLGAFPSRTVPLIRECVEALVSWHSDPRFKSPQAWPEYLKPAVERILAPLALESVQSGTIPEKSIDHLKEEDRKIFFEYLVPARFIEKRKDNYAFPLETFREYFAAQGVAKSADPFAVIQPHLHEAAWRKVILYAAGSLPYSEAPLIDNVLPKSTRILSKNAGPLAGVAARLVPNIGGAAGKAIDAVTDGVQPKVDAWFDRALHSVEHLVRSILKHRCLYEHILHRNAQLALICLKETEDFPDKLLEDVLRLLQNILRWWHPYVPGVKQTLSEAVVHPKIRRELLRERYLTGYDERQFAGPVSLIVHSFFNIAKANRQIWDKWDEQGFIEVFKGVAREPEVRERISKLANAGYPRFSAFIFKIKALKETASDGATQQELIELADTKFAQWYTSFLANEKEKHAQERIVRSIRCDALQALNGVALDPLVEQKVVKLAQHDPDERVRESALETLKTISLNYAGRLRMLELTNSEEPRLRKIAATALTRAGVESGVWPRLVELSFDNDLEVVIAAAQGLKNAAVQNEITMRLLELTRHENHRVRRAAFGGLASQTGNPLVRQRLLELSESLGKADWRRMEEIAPLAGIVSEPVVQQRLVEYETSFAQYMGRRVEMIRETREILKSAPVLDGCVLDVILANMCSEDLDVLRVHAKQPTVKRRLLESLRRELPPSDGSRGLLETLRRLRDRHIDLGAQDSLFGPAGPVEVLEALRDSGDDAEVIQAVLPLTRHPDSRLREKAAKVLRPAASQPDVQAVLVKLLEDRSDGVRKEAIIALRSDLPQSDIRLLRKIISGEKKQDEWQEATQTLKLLLEAWETRLANPKRAGR